jgi:hypothetical protein
MVLATYNMSDHINSRPSYPNQSPLQSPWIIVTMIRELQNTESLTKHASMLPGAEVQTQSPKTWKKYCYTHVLPHIGMGNRDMWGEGFGVWGTIAHGKEKQNTRKLVSGSLTPRNTNHSNSRWISAGPETGGGEEEEEDGGGGEGLRGDALRFASDVDCARHWGWTGPGSTRASRGGGKRRRRGGRGRPKRRSSCFFNKFFRNS